MVDELTDARPNRISLKNIGILEKLIHQYP